MIFEDNTGKRWRAVKIIFFTGVFILALLISLQVLHRYGIVYVPLINDYIRQFFTAIAYAFFSYMFLTIIIGFLRMVVLITFCYRQKRKNKIIHEYRKVNKRSFKTFRPDVAVIIPVYNEEVVISRTILSILKSDYPIKEVLVIDDGSTDNTAEIVSRLSYCIDKVKLIRKKNGGKASALNLGFKKSSSDIIITVDADTMFHKNTIAHLVAHFADPRVAAVSGNCKIGNIVNQMSLWQHIEYVTANQIEKRAFEELNCITVVPGSNSALRKSVVKEVGFYHSDTLAEDAELTIRILNAGYKIIYEDRAISFEECPETLKDFIKQRSRWSYGVLQVSWKHRKQIVNSPNKTLKYFAVPSLIFSYLLLFTAPLIDVIFVIALMSGASSVYFFVLLFYLTDFLNSFIAFRIGKEKLKPLLWIFIQRIAYRYMLAYVAWGTIIKVLKGGAVGWRKLKRSGNNGFKL